MRLLAWLAIVVASASGLWMACSTVNVHPFIAGQYMANLDCVTPGEAIDVLDGLWLDASCDATCVVPPFEAGVFVSGACPPFPPGDDTSGKNPLCPKALAAAHRNDLCLEAGPSNPIVDAGTDQGVADAGVLHDGQGE